MNSGADVMRDAARRMGRGRLRIAGVLGVIAGAVVAARFGDDRHAAARFMRAVDEAAARLGPKERAVVRLILDRAEEGRG